MTLKEFNEICKKHKAKVFGVYYKKLTEKDIVAIIKVIKELEGEK